MPKRVIDGESLWTSDKLAEVRPEYRAEYAYLLPLATANGTFECSPRLIWRTCYSYARQEVTPEIVADILDELERAKMLFRWQADGKTYGYWVGIDKSGRLPPASRNSHEKRGPDVPQDELGSFLGMASQRLTTGYPPDNQPEASGSLGKGIGKGKGKGKGIGIGIGIGGEAGVSKADFACSSLSSSSFAQHSCAIKARSQTCESGGSSVSEQNRPEGESSPVREENPLCGQKPDHPLAEEQEMWAAHRKRLEPLLKGWEPIRNTLEDWDALDWAFTRGDSPLGDIPAKTARRTVYYHWNCNMDSYWRSAKAGITSPQRLEKALPEMLKQVPEDWIYPGGAYSKTLTVADPDCPTCHGRGYVVIDHPSYAPGMFEAVEKCKCVKFHPAPWRIDYHVMIA